MGHCDFPASVPRSLDYAKRYQPPASVLVTPHKPDAGLGPGLFGSGRPYLLRRGGDEGSLKFLGSPIVPMLCSQTPAGPDPLGQYHGPARPPPGQRRRLLRLGQFRGLRQGFSTRCLRFARQVTRADARLTCGAGQALRSGTFTRRTPSIGFFDASYFASSFPRLT